MALTPESSAYTSVRMRCGARQRHRAARRVQEVELFVAPLAWRMRVANGQDTTRALAAEEYLTLVDLTGGVLRPGKRGAIDPRLPALLARLDLRLDAWVATMTGWRQMQGSGLGSRASRDAEATARAALVA